MSAAATCSEASAAAAEPLAATATEAVEWLLVEVRGAWGRDGVGDTAMPEIARAALASFGGRAALVRRPDRRGADAGIAVIRATVQERGGAASGRTLASLEELDPADLDAGTPIAAPVVLVCAHGRRDACCARLGVPLFDALGAHLAADRLWQATHLGGHRFAPNVVVLPHGIQLGRVPPARAGEVAALLEQGRIPLDLYRGRVLYARPVQAAEILVRSVTGCDGVGDLRLVAHDGDVVVFETPAGELAARVEERPGPTVPGSCGDDPEPTATWTAHLQSAA